MAEQYVVEQLSPKEKIEDEHKIGDTTWYATNKRVLKFKKDWLGSKSLRDLDYRHIVSINLEEESWLWLLIVSAIIFIVGFIIIPATEGELVSISIIMFVIAIILSAVAVFHRPSYYQFNAPSIKFEDWRMEDTKTRQGKEFIQIVRKHSFFRSKGE